MKIDLTDSERGILAELRDSDAELLARIKQNQEIRNRVFARIVKDSGITGKNWKYDEALSTLDNGEE